MWKQYVIHYWPIALSMLAMTVALIFLVKIFRFKAKEIGELIGKTVSINGKSFVVKDISIMWSEVQLVDNQRKTIKIRSIDQIKAEKLISI